MRRSGPEARKGSARRDHEEGDERRPAPPCRARTASRCCATPTATASPETRTVFLDGPQLAVRHGAGRRRPLRREHRRASCASRTAPARRRSTAPGDEGRRPAGRPAQSSLDQERHREPRRLEALRDGRLEQQRRRERHGERRAPRGDSRDRPRDRRIARVRVRPAQSERPGLAAADAARCGPP